MDKIKIRIENFFQILRLFVFDKVLQRFLWLEGILLFIALVIMVYYLSSLPGDNMSNNDDFIINPENSEKVSTLSPDIFYSETVLTDLKSHPKFVKLYLTGIGRVKGIYKASIEDAQGNYYYVCEGEKVKGMLVKKIADGEVVLIDEYGNYFRLKLEK